MRARDRPNEAYSTGLGWANTRVLPWDKVLHRSGVQPMLQ